MKCAFLNCGRFANKFVTEFHNNYNCKSEKNSQEGKSYMIIHHYPNLLFFMIPQNALLVKYIAQSAISECLAACNMFMVMLSRLVNKTQ